MRHPMICTRCYHVGHSVQVEPYGFVAELLVWVFFWWTVLLPIAVSIGRWAKMREGCASCSADALVPFESPRGRELYEQVHEPVAV